MSISSPTGNERSSVSPILILCFGAVCISFAAIFVKGVGGAVSPTGIGMWRTFFGAMILFPLALLMGQPLTLDRKLIGWSALAGFVFFLDLFFWHRSIVYAGAGMGTILANTQVFTTACLGYFIFKEKLSLGFFVPAITAMAGVALLIGVGSDIEFSGMYLQGIVFGLLTGLAYAGYLTTLRLASLKVKLPNLISFMAWTSLFSALFFLPTGLIEMALDPDATSIWTNDLNALAVLFGLGLVAQSLGWLAISKSVPHIPSARAGLILLLQPILATVWGVIFFAERLSMLQVAGAMLTIVSIYFGARFRLRPNQPNHS